jgi:hypothetical protein
LSFWRASRVVSASMMPFLTLLSLSKALYSKIGTQCSQWFGSASGRPIALL